MSLDTRFDANTDDTFEGAMEGIALDPRMEGVRMPMKLLLLVNEGNEGTNK
jgi:hypothetical protein